MDANEAVTAAIEAAFPGRRVERTAEPGPSWNDDNRTVVVEFDGDDPPRAYLKVTLTGDGSRRRRETAAIRHVAARDAVPAPAVLAADPDGDPPYVATRPLEGESLRLAWDDADGEERAALARSFGRALAAVHETRLDRHGRVAEAGADPIDLRVDPRPWPDLLAEQIELTRDLADPGRFDDQFDRVLAVVDDHRDLLSDAPATLVRGDPARPNAVRVADGVGLLDWELAHAGDPARELARARHQALDPLRGEADERLVRALHDGYRDRAGSLPSGFERRRGPYRAVAFLGTAGHFERWIDWNDAPADDLAAWVEAEMDRRLDAV